MHSALHMMVAGGLVLAGTALAHGAETGKTMGVIPAASAETSGVSRVLIAGTDVAVGDVVKTDTLGQVEILFTEGTKLVVGPRSALKLEAYLLRSGNSPGKFAVNALSGSFRFMTGTMEKNDYTIKTPTGTIGVRGTEFDFSVDGDGTSVVLYEGEVRVCAENGECATLTDRCDSALMTDDAAALLSEDNRRTQRVRAKFPIAMFQSRLTPPFRLDAPWNCLQALNGGGGSPGLGIQNNPPARIVAGTPVPPITYPDAPGTDNPEQPGVDGDQPGDDDVPPSGTDGGMIEIDDNGNPIDNR